MADVLLKVKAFPFLSFKKVIIVCGGAGGIGSSIVQRFLNDGASVALVDVNGEYSKQLIESNWSDYAKEGKICFYLGDISSRSKCFSVIDKVS